MFNLFKKNKQKTELEIAADNVLKAIDETQAAIEKRNAVFADVNAEMQRNLDLLRSIGMEVQKCQLIR